MSNIIPKPITKLNVPSVYFTPYGVLADGMFIDSGKPAKFPIRHIESNVGNDFGKDQPVLGMDTNFNGCGFFAEHGKLTTFNKLYLDKDRYGWRSFGNMVETAWKCSLFNNAITLQDGRFLSASPCGDIIVDASGATPVDPNGSVYEGHTGNSGYQTSNLNNGDIRVLGEVEPNVLLRAPSNISVVYSGTTNVYRSEAIKHEVGGKTAIAKYIAGRTTNAHALIHFRKEHNVAFSIASLRGASPTPNSTNTDYLVSVDIKTGNAIDNGSILDSFRTGFYSNPISGNNAALYRGFPICRSVIETEEETSLLFMKPDYNEDDTLKSVGLLRADHNSNGVISEPVYEIVAYNEDGSLFVCEENDFPYKSGTLRNDYTVNSATNGTLFDHVSKLFEIDGEQYVSCMFLPTHLGYNFSNENVQKNTIQYTFKLDQNDRKRMTLVSKEETYGTFGKYFQGINTFMFGVNDELFMMTHEGLMTAYFDTETFLWVCSDRNIAIHDLRCLYQDEASNLWLMDAKNNLYNIQSEDTNIVNFDYPKHITYDAGENSTVTIGVSVKNLAGDFLAKDLRLEVDGNATFSNGSKTYSVLTTDTGASSLNLKLTGHGTFNVIVKDVL